MQPIFPKQSDRILRLCAGALLGVAALGISVFAYVSRPEYFNTGYSPVQPIAYSHKLHAGNLGLDCRYCHSTVERAGYAAIPATETCMNCHARVKTQSPQLQLLRDSYAAGQSIPWVKIHHVPDFVYFNHQAHVTAGVGCISCHGRVDQMIEVKQMKPLSMGWCLDCHRNPAPNLRPAALVTKMDWTPDRDPAEIGREIMAAKHIQPPTNCSGCHR